MRYREEWDQYLPKLGRGADGKPTLLNPDWCVAYNPIAATRTCYSPTPEITKLSERAYFVIISNNARDQRRRDKAKQVKDPLQESLVDKGRIIAEFEEFLLCPNDYPHHFYASLLIGRSQSRRQECPTPADIDAWMRFSILTRQYVFFNSQYAGASIFTRMHAHVVDPSALWAEGKQVIYPLLNQKTGVRRSIKEGIDVLNCYALRCLSFGAGMRLIAPRLLSRSSGATVGTRTTS